MQGMRGLVSPRRPSVWERLVTLSGGKVTGSVQGLVQQEPQRYGTSQRSRTGFTLLTTPSRCSSTSASPEALTPLRGLTGSRRSTRDMRAVGLPVLGAVTAPSAVLIRPDGYVARVGDGTDVRLRDALATWFGTP